MPVIRVNGLNINYEVIGDKGPWTTLITGGRRGYSEFIPLAKKIAAKGFRVLMHDRRNTGSSDTSFEGTEVEEVTWAEDLYEILKQLNALPAFIGGSSSGARTAILFGLRYPEVTSGLLLFRVTGGAFAAERLPENYYNQFIRMAKEGGMQAVCEDPQYAARIVANPMTGDLLKNMNPEDFIKAMSHWHDQFVAGKDLPVFGVSESELNSMNMPVIIIPGNDKVHDSAAGRIVHEMIRGSELHKLPIEDQDLPLVPFEEWSPHEPEITEVFTEFMSKHAGQA